MPSSPGGGQTGTLLAFRNLANILGELSRWAPWSWLVLFLAASALMIWRLGALEQKGFQGTVLGTLIMPYCTGLSNILFAVVMGKTGANGALVLENCLVNNITNATLLLGLPALIWSLDVPAGRRPKKPGPGPGSGSAASAAFPCCSRCWP